MWRMLSPSEPAAAYHTRRRSFDRTCSCGILTLNATCYGTTVLGDCCAEWAGPDVRAAACRFSRAASTTNRGLSLWWFLMDAVIIYWSKTGNTEKVALAIQEGLEEAGVTVSLKRVEDADDVDFYAYDLVCIGFPSYRWSPPAPMDVFLNSKFRQYHAERPVKGGAPTAPGKNAVVFCTYSGTHTGIREAIPAGLYAGQFFEHLGFTVRGEWYVVGEFHGSEEASTMGRLGDIRGRPNEDDLRRVRQDVARLVRALRSST